MKKKKSSRTSSRTPVAWVLRVVVPNPKGRTIQMSATTASRDTATSLGDEWLKEHPSARVTIYPIFSFKEK